MTEQSDLLLGGSQEWDQGYFMHMCVSVCLCICIKSVRVCVYFTMLSYKLYGLGMN